MTFLRLPSRRVLRRIRGMRIECPTCQAAYEVPEAKLAGRKLRCSQCSTEWVPLAAAVEASGGPELPPFTAIPREPLLGGAGVEAAVGAGPAAAAWRRRDYRPVVAAWPWPLIGAWAATAVLVVVAIAVAVIRRDAIMGAWPASERLFAALGLR